MAMTEKDAAAHAKDMARRITDAEKSRPAGLEIAARAIDAKLETLRIERLRVAHKYGPEHARVVRISARIDATTDQRRGVASEIQRSSIRGPRPDRNVAAIHGRVIDGQQLGVSGLTVRARIAGELTEIGKTGTDDAGHFFLSVPRQKPEDQEVAVILEVLTGNYRVAYRDSESRQLPFGSVVYTEIEIADRSGPRTAAPAEESPGKPGAGSTSEPPRPRPPRARAAKKR